MKLVPVLSVIGALASGIATAQSLSLDEAIATARQHNAKLEAGRQMAAAAAGQVRTSKGAFLPELGASANYSEYDGDVFFARFIPAIPGIPPPTPIGDFDSNESLLVVLQQPLYAGGGNSAKLAASKVEEEIAERDVAQLDSELVFDVTRAYLQVLLADKSLEVARASVQRTEQNQSSVQRLRAEEEALEVDVLAVQTQLASDRHSLDAAENDRMLAAAALNRLLGRDQGAPVQPVDILGQPGNLGSEEEALARIEASNPEIQKAGLRVELADAGIKGARSYYHPKLRLDGLYSWVENELFFDGEFWGVGLEVSIPFLRAAKEGGGSVATARARKSAAMSSLEETKSLVSLGVRSAWSEATEANLAVAVAEQNRRYHQEKYRVTSSAFAESLKTFDDVLDDHVDLSEAELKLYQAQYQARLREAEARRLLGGS
jgi:outer membrane protein TolC